MKVKELFEQSRAPGEYVFHASYLPDLAKGVKSIISKGLIPSKEGYNGSGVYFAYVPQDTYHHVSKDDATMFRVKWADLKSHFGVYPSEDAKIERDSEEIIVRAAVPAKFLEVEYFPDEWWTLEDVLGAETAYNESLNIELTEAKRDEAYIKEAYRRWRKLVNMPTSTLEKFLATKEGREAGLTRKEAAKAGGIKTGHQSARAILRMRDKPFSEWSTEDINWMFRQISFVSRMTGLEGPLFKETKDGKKIPTRKLTSLWIWGHSPTGHSPAKYGIFK